MYARSQKQENRARNVAYCRFCDFENKRKCMGQSCGGTFQLKYGDNLVDL